MADAGVIINAKLDSENLTQQIDALVNSVTKKFNDMATNIQESVDKVKTSIRSIKDTARSNVSQIKQAFDQLGTTFDNFARAMQRAAAAASGLGGAGGRGGTGGTGGIVTPQDFSQSNVYQKTIEELRQMIAEQQKYINTLQVGTAELQKQVNELAKGKNYLKEMTTSSSKLRQQNFNDRFGDLQSMSTTTFQQTKAKLILLRRMMADLNNQMQASGLGVNFLPQRMWNQLQKAIDTTEQKLERLRKTASMPTTLNMGNVLGMSEKTLDQISLKMRAIQQLRAQTPVGSTDISRLNAEYARLSKMQSEIIGKNATLVESNNALGRAFNYIRNRLAFTLTIGAFTGFVRQLYEVRGQYELLERSLGVLLNSFSKGSQIFNELNQMAIKSPFTLIELGTAAKQLTAYNFKANEVVNTTKRLADISAALGVPMERLVYNLGQIRAQGVLTARDARDFANAGLAIVPELATYFTKLEGHIVSTGDVYERLSKKAVSFNDVMSVINKVTDEGGKFFDFQAKQAETLKVQMANLNLAWNNMLNDMGQSHQGLLEAPLIAMRELFKNWRLLNKVIKEVVISIGAYKTYQLLINNIIGASTNQIQKQVLANKRYVATQLERKQLTQALTTEELRVLATRKMVTAADYEAILVNKNLSKTQAMLLVGFNRHNKELMTALIRMKLLTAEEIRSLSTWKLLTLSIKNAGVSLLNFGRAVGAFFAQNAWLLAIGAVLGAIYEISSANKEAERNIKELNQAIIDGAKESQKALNDFLVKYSDYYHQLLQTDNYVLKEPKYTQNLDTETANKAWEEMKETILESTSASNSFLVNLESISDVNDRLRAGFGLLRELRDAEGVLKDINEESIKISSTKLGGLFGEGLVRDLNDYMGSLDLLIRKYGDVEKARQAVFDIKETGSYIGISHDLHDLYELLGELGELSSSMVATFIKDNDLGINAQREAFERTISSIAQTQNLNTEQYLSLRVAAEERYFTFANNYYVRLAKTQTGIQRQATEEKLAALKEEFNSNKAMQENFFQWLSDTNSSHVEEMLRNKSDQEIKNGEWMTKENIRWIEQQTKAFAEKYGYSFETLRQYVLNANTWSINIPVFFKTIMPPTPLQETLQKAGLAGQYINGVTSATQALSNLKKAQKEVADELKTINDGLKVGVQYSQAYINSKEEENKSLTNQIHNLGGLTDAEEKAAQASAKANKNATNRASREQKKQEDAVAKALSQELSVINEMQSAYDKLRKAGVGSTEALQLASSGYDRTLKSINATLSKYGIKAFKAEDFVGSNDPHKLLKALEDQLDTLVKSGKVKTSSLKDLEMEIKKIRVDAREYDMKKITEGLNNELGKIKEEYELAVELDANPELGQMFAESFGIDTTNFPKTVQKAVDMMQDAADKAIAESTFGEGVDMDTEDLLHSFDILRDDIDEWAKSTGLSISNELKDILKKLQHDARDLYAKDAKETISDWQKLLEKYAEYEYKKAEIQRKAEKEREVARKHGASQEIFDAIDLKELREIEKLNFDEFQKSATWITATGDLSNLTNKALQMLIDKLWEYKKAAKNLDPKDIIKLNKAMRKLRTEQKKDNPFSAWSIMLDEAKERMEQYEPDIEELSRKIQNLLKKQAEQHGILSDEDNQTLAQYLKNLEKLRKEQNEVGKLTLGDKLGAIQKYSSAIKEIADSVITIADGFGAEKISKAAEALKDALGIIDKAEAGYKLGGTYGAVAGAVVGITEMLVKWFDTNEDINEEIEFSQRQVKRLENQYKDLQHAMEQAYGVAKYGAQQAMIYNKKLQLAQLEEQLRLEKSRKSKHKDEDAIISLEGQIIDLKNEIHDAVNSIVTDMLGISSVGDAAENVVKSMIEAFKNGEDYMKVFEESFDDMIDNMIAKTIVSRLIGDFIQGIFDQIKAKKTTDASMIADSLSYAQSVLDGLYDFAKEFGMTDSIQRNINEWETNVKNLQDAYNSAITPTPEDVAELQATISAGKASIKEGFEAWMDAFGIKFGQNAGETNLSALQQGIQGITEDTAGALEAYMNGVSQQVYYQSDLLTQIRDILVNFGGDVTIATNAQILLQLQQSFQVQMTIQAILQGWSNASGLAMRVELVS